MTRLIDADELIEIINYTFSKPPFSRKTIKHMIDMARTVDAVPVKGGKWIDDGQYDNFFPHHEWRCSECGEHVLEIGVPWFKYCPNCGARMDGDRDEPDKRL